MCFMQVKGHSLKPREGHSATAFAISQEVTEVIMFGGIGVSSYLSDTTVLRFGELILESWWYFNMSIIVRARLICNLIRESPLHS